MKKTLLRYCALLLPLCILGGAVMVHLAAPLSLKLLRLHVFDSYQRIQPRTYEEVPVTILDIDEASLKKLGQWPWSRDKMAQLINNMAAMGVAAVGLDIVFAEADRTSPALLVPQWNSVLEHRLEFPDLPDHDALFAQAIKEFNVVSGTVLSSGDLPHPVKKFGLVNKGADPLPLLYPYDGAISSLDAITSAASGNGALNSIPDGDGLIRKVPLIFTVKNRVFPGLAAETLRIAQGASTYVVQAEETGVTQVRVGEFTVPTDKYGHVWIHYTPYRPERYVPAWEVLQPDFDASRMAGHIVLLGTSAAGLKDIRTTPLNPVTNGVEIHAQALEQILLQHFLTRPDWIETAELLYMVLAGLLVWGAIARLSPYLGVACTLIILCGSVAFSWYAFAQHRMLVDPLSPGIIIVVLYFTESLRRYISIERERRQVRSAFSHYMSPALVARLAKNPESLTLGGEMRDMTILFCDIRGFTTISEQFDAEGLTKFINRFLTPMTNIILDRQGTIDKYMGDCIMAFWNAPLDDDRHVESACRAALEMMLALDTLNASREKEAAEENIAFIPVRIGIGLNTDVCCVGNMGSDQRFDYSVLGDGVNLASRLEGQSKQYGMDIVIGENTAKHLDVFATLELDLLMVKGKTTATRIYGLMGDETLTQQEGWSTLRHANETMLACYRAMSWEDALQELETLLHYADVLSLNLKGYVALYQERIATYKRTPPPNDWDGVYVATSK